MEFFSNRVSPAGIMTVDDEFRLKKIAVVWLMIFLILTFSENPNTKFSIWRWRNYNIPQSFNTSLFDSIWNIIYIFTGKQMDDGVRRSSTPGILDKIAADWLLVLMKVISVSSDLIKKKTIRQTWLNIYVEVLCKRRGKTISNLWFSQKYISIEKIPDFH